MDEQDFAEKADANDELRKFRGEFHIARQPPHTEADEESVYLCGNSLGLLPKRAQEYVNVELKKWALAGVEGHFEGERPWYVVDEPCVKLSMPLVGARIPEEVAIMNSLSTNLHLMMVPFFNPTPTRHKILMEARAFCSDQHVVRSQLAFHGLTEEESLIELAPREGETYLRPEDILEVIEKEGDSVALMLFSGVQFYTGQLFDMKTITEAGLKKGCRVGFDLAHCVGNVPVQLHDWNVDFACWCSYKYLNSGPGCLSGVFVHEKHHNDQSLKRFAGWWGQEPDTRFRMSGVHDTKPGAQGFQLSNPPMLPMVCLQASLELFQEAGIEKLREKSIKLTAYLEHLINARLKDHVTIFTPSDPLMRGCQLSLKFSQPVEDVHKAITKAGVICDVRRPDVMRIAPVPMYNTFSDVKRFVDILATALGVSA